MNDTQTNSAIEEAEKKRAQEILDQDVLLAWTTPDSRHHERGPLWYVTAVIVGILLILYAIFTAAWTLAVVVAVLAGVIYLMSQEPVGSVEVIITAMGIHVNKKFYPYHTIKSFWIVSEPGVKILYFQLRGKLQRIINVRMDDENSVTVRQVLANELEEETERGEHFSDAWARKLKL